MAAQINMPFGMEVDLGPDDIVSDGDLVPPPQKGGRAPLPNFLTNVYCGQTAGWIKMALGRGGHWSRLHCARWGTSVYTTDLLKPGK